MQLRIIHVQISDVGNHVLVGISTGRPWESAGLADAAMLRSFPVLDRDPDALSSTYLEAVEYAAVALARLSGTDVSATRPLW